jgi:hypothetical protein
MGGFNDEMGGQMEGQMEPDGYEIACCAMRHVLEHGT